MPHRFAAALAGIVLAVGSAPLAVGDPRMPPPPGPAPAEALPAADATPLPPGPASAADAVPVANAVPPGPPPDTGAVPSEPPVSAQTLDGRTITVAAKDETQLPVAPLTTAQSSRDWVVGGTFTGETTGSVAGGTLEVGYQIACSVEMDRVELYGGLTGILGDTNFGQSGLILPPSASLQVNGAIEVDALPGTVTTVNVKSKEFKGTSARVTLRDIHIGVDGCVGASSLRSYAVLTSSSPEDDDIVAYYGATKVF
ncbi:MAG: MspA family porin [Actinomycetia bacterium]|nr:MspA family porin [Actinomycetes bacterium]MCH9700761.1 MspA family porin [Actinomycetes bacterium]MCH9760908.1 MspA family porin [Actinomycetes bacterium]